MEKSWIGFGHIGYWLYQRTVQSWDSVSTEIHELPSLISSLNFSPMMDLVRDQRTKTNRSRTRWFGPEMRNPGPARTRTDCFQKKSRPTRTRNSEKLDTSGRTRTNKNWKIPDQFRSSGPRTKRYVDPWTSYRVISLI